MTQRLLLIGWDSADWRLLRPLMAAGKMPHLSALVERGISGNIATLHPMLSPMLWTSIATGKRADKHGIHGFVEPDPQGGVRPCTTLSRKTKALWNILTQSGKRSNVVGWWPSHPVEPISGVMVSNHFQQPPEDLAKSWALPQNCVHPPQLAPLLRDLRVHPADLDCDMLLPFVPKAAAIDQNRDRRLLVLAKIIAETSSVHAVATALMQNEPWDFMAVYHDSLDHFGHTFMRYHPPRHPKICGEDFEFYGGVVEAACRFYDAMLGVLLGLVGSDTRVLLISDHGFHSDHLRPESLPNEPAGPAAEHRGIGIFVMAGPGICKGTSLTRATLLDVAPTILHSFGLPVGDDMDGKVLLPVFENPGPVARIPSWDLVPGEAGTHSMSARLDAGEAAAGLQQLVALGYVEPPNHDATVAAEEARREQRYNLAQVYMDAGQYSKAAAICGELWNQWPEESRFGAKLLQSHMALRKARESRATLDLLLDRRRVAAKNAGAELKLLLAKHRTDSDGETAGPDFFAWSADDLKLYRKLVGRSAIDPEVLRYLEARVLLIEKRYDEAKAIFTSLEETAPAGRELTLHLALGEIALRQRCWDVAMSHFERCHSIDAENRDAFYGLGQAFLFRREPMKAAAFALRAVELDFFNPRAHFLYGVALTRCGKADWAVDSFLEAVRQAPDFSAAHRRLGRIYKNLFQEPQKAAWHFAMASGHSVPSLEDNDTPDLMQAATPEANATWASLSITGRCAASPEESITVVTGLPRSGTSLMMQMLAAGGARILTDGGRIPDISNPEGYLEYEPVKRMPHDMEWLQRAKGRAVKIVIPLVRHLPPQYSYRIVWMWRPLEEVLASQSTMLANRELESAGREDLKKFYQFQLEESDKAIRSLPYADCLTLDYRDCVKNPRRAVEWLKEFVVLQGGVEEMMAAIKPTLYRQKA